MIYFKNLASKKKSNNEYAFIIYIYSNNIWIDKDSKCGAIESIILF